VLYLALEDGPSRMKDRMACLVGDDVWPARLSFAHQWPRLDKGGFEALRIWLRQHPDAAMIVIDTFTRIRPPKDARGDSYQQDADVTALLQGLALEFHVAIVLVLHQRKAQSDDPFDSVSGTLGMTASADAIAVLDRKPKAQEGKLSVTGRDIEEQALGLVFHEGRWTCTGELEEEVESDSLDAAKAFIRECLKGGPMESGKLFKEGARAGFTQKNLYEAKNALHIKPYKSGFQGKWVWSL
jgi:hypothetical protein